MDTDERAFEEWLNLATPAVGLSWPTSASITLLRLAWDAAHRYHIASMEALRDASMGVVKSHQEWCDAPSWSGEPLEAMQRAIAKLAVLAATEHQKED